jgi:hypothetical protein
MAIVIPTEKFDGKIMFEAAAEASKKGFLKSQEAQVRITTDMLQELYLAGYKQCMADHGIPIDPEAGIIKG